MATILRCDHCGSPIDTREYARRACAQCGSMLVTPRAAAPAPPPAPVLYALPSPDPLPVVPSSNPVVVVFVAMGVAMAGVRSAFFFLAVRAPTIPDRPPTPVAVRAPVEPERPVEGLPEAPTRPSKPMAPSPQRPTPAPPKSAKTDTCAQAAAACAEDPRGTRCSTLQAKCTP